MAEERHRQYRWAFWAAVVITVAAWLLPFGNLAIYPFSMLATWAHEMGHGMAALVVGGRFERLQLFADLSGMATTASSGAVSQALVAAGGLIGAPLLGAVVIALGVRQAWSRGILLSLSAVMVLSVLFWVRNLYGVVSLLLFGAGAALAGLKLGPRPRFVVVQLVGIQLSLSLLRGWQYLFSAEADMGWGSLPSDVSLISQALFGPHWLWGGLLLVFNLMLLYGAYRLALRRLVPSAPRQQISA